jgi:hypothetical protein
LANATGIVSQPAPCDSSGTSDHPSWLKSPVNGLGAGPVTFSFHGSPSGSAAQFGPEETNPELKNAVAHDRKFAAVNWAGTEWPTWSGLIQMGEEGLIGFLESWVNAVAMLAKFAALPLMMPNAFLCGTASRWHCVHAWAAPSPGAGWAVMLQLRFVA